MSTSINPGSESYYQQLAALQSLPNDPSSLAYLQKLSSTPNSPFQQFLVQGRMDQIAKNLAAQKGMQAQAQVGGGLPTIKQKQDQAVQTLLAQTAMAGKGPMPHPMAQAQPAQQGQQQQQQQQEEEEPPQEAPVQAAAKGGIMHAPVHKDMFNFAPGGIVAFANPESEKKQQVKDDLVIPDIGNTPTPTQSSPYPASQADLAALQQMVGSGSNPTIYSPPPSGQDITALQEFQGSGSNPTVYSPPQSRVAPPSEASGPIQPAQVPAVAPNYKPIPEQGQSTAGAVWSALGGDTLSHLWETNKAKRNMESMASEQAPGLFEKLTKGERASRNAALDSILSGNTAGLSGRVVTDPAERARLEALRTGQPVSTAPAGIPGIAPAAGNLPEGTPGQRPTMANDPRLSGGINSSAIKPPAGNPAGNIGAHPGNPAASPSAALPVNNEQTTAAKDYHDQQLARAKAEQDLLDNTKPKSREELIKSELELQKLFHIGDYEKLTRDLIAERDRRHNEDKAGRGWNDAMAQLAAFTRPGARWSDVIGTDVRSKAAHEQEDKEFYDAQDKYLDAVNKAAEARNEGSVSRIHATELEQTKARQEAVKAVMQSKGIGLNAAEHYIATLNTNAVAKYGHDVSRMNAAERATSQLEIAALKRQAQLDNFDRNYGAALNKTEYGSLSKERAKLQSDLAPLAGADQNLAFIKGKKDRLQQIETRMEQIQNAFLGGIANNAAGSTPAPTATAGKATYRVENGQIVPNK